MEIFEVTQLSNVDVSIILILSGALMLYFGKIIKDFQGEVGDRLEYYKQGAVFIIFIIVIPGIVGFFASEYIENKINIINKEIFLPLFIIILLLFIFLLIMLNFKTKYNINYYFYIIDNKFSKMKSFKDKIYKSIIIISENQITLSIMSFLTVFSEITFIKISIKFLNTIILFLFIVFTNFIVYTAFAIIYGFSIAYYPEVIVFAEENKKFTGKLLRSSDYIELIDNNKIIRINSDKVLYIEEVESDDNIQQK